MKKTLPTQFAPAERATRDQIDHQVEQASCLTMLKELLDGVPEIVFILNEQRQTIFANQEVLSSFGRNKKVIGARPGEILGCIHAAETAGGCGTTEACRKCGTTQAILSIQKGADQDIQECRISQEKGGALDFRVKTKPIMIANKPFTMFHASDISHEKRRVTLEHVLFNDILSATIDIREETNGLILPTTEDLDMFKAHVDALSQEVVEDINRHRIVDAAENGSLIANPEMVSTAKLFRQLAKHYQFHDLCKNKILDVDLETNIQFKSDPVLLKYTLGHLIHNALEAVEEEGTVKLWAGRDGKRVVFFVHNPGVIPHDVQLQIFQRSYSTKGKGRGLGTYTARLLSEKYLRGEVTFRTSQIDGTTFIATFDQIY